jgi:hypothetical protein
MSTDHVGTTSDAPPIVPIPSPAPASAGEPLIIESPVPTLLQRIGGWFTRFFVRFGLVFLFCFLLGRVAGMVPGFGWLAGQSFVFWRRTTLWFGKSVLKLTQTISLANTGSGDKLYNWLELATMVSFAAVGALIWVWFDRRRRGDAIAHEALRIGLRYSLGMIMLSYGISKVLYQQMPAPYAARLFEPYGESSPMGLLWTFMGQSWAYSAFAGGLEALGGLLLFHRRTTTLGALLVIAVMTNVSLMNFTFDVPVKLHSTLYLIFAVVLVAPDMRRLINVLVLNRPTVPRAIAFPWLRGRPLKLLAAAKWIFVCGLLWNGTGQRVWSWLERPAPVKSPLHGMYEVVTFTRNDKEVAANASEAARWRRIIIDEQSLATLTMGEARIMYRARLGPGPGKLTVETFVRGGAPARNIFTYQLSDGNARLKLEGTINGMKLAVELRRSDAQKMQLRTRGFHWISEAPYNR